MELLKLERADGSWVNISSHIERKGYGWSREDGDSAKTGRTKNFDMRRDKIGTKRKLYYKLINATRAQLAEIDDCLSQPTFRAEYLDLHGVMTKTFYCSSFSATLSDLYDEDGAWCEGAFNMIEV